MIKPAREAEPLFSQPVRQVVMMLIVIGLVGAGAYLAFARISPIFLANPYLNGLILGVFVLGVLTCFWQVVQLVQSVSWIEGFAANRPGHEVTVPPRMLAPLAALLRSRTARSSHISNSSARSILESVSARIDEARDITRYLINLLIFLGLLGTFYGLATTVPAVVDTIRALAPHEGETGMQVFDKLMTGLEAQLGGMGTAFSSSLLGLAGSLVVGLLELFAGHGQNRFYSELEDWLSSFTRLSLAGSDGEGGVDGAGLADVIDQMANQVEALTDLFSQAEAGRIRTDDALVQLAQAVHMMAERNETAAGSGAALDRIAAGQDKIVQGQDKLVSIMEKGAAEPAVDGSDAEARMRLRSIDVQLLKILEEVAAGRQEAVAELRSDLAQLTRAVRSLVRIEPSAPPRKD
ncbi:biopolymer transporter ExbB [Defluviimonas sp. WL0002]|uniref:Biopolymer transporter ExbB n=1 Tax=Albidovulum marisflavi TaxID=2984159 RepID=A0ABT2ZEG1_9RHOB|nr:biopolymer transporter ExbB [Defluviimonas sp. WL0002]MCV2869507.1 biopolymer transporter ExbB [Defluviimonas sp. WL0002]